MTLYTVMPEDLIWQNTLEQDTPSTMEINIGGLHMQVEPLNDNKAKIIRLLNCELADYLNPQYAPGSTISFVPVLDQNRAKV